MYAFSLLANTAKKICPSTLRNDIVLNWLILLASFDDSFPFPLHKELPKLKKRQLLFTLYGIPLGPGADRDLAFLQHLQLLSKLFFFYLKVLLIVLLAIPLSTFQVDCPLWGLNGSVLSTLLPHPFYSFNNGNHHGKVIIDESGLKFNS